MLSPFMTVVILAVLWLIVVVPMILRRNDERRRRRSVDNFGRAMGALGRRNSSATSTAITTVDKHADVFVPYRRRSLSAASTRRTDSAAEEASMPLMSRSDRSEMSQARAHMLARRRRSLAVLIGGSLIFGVAAVVMGAMMWFAAAPFFAGLVGYLWFLRSQASRDRARRESRERRAAARRPDAVDLPPGATPDIAAPVGRFEAQPESVVRIDDDDIELHSMETIDLTGLYHEELTPAVTQRRAS